MHRWQACPGSIRLSDAVPAAARKESRYAAEGTAAHELAATALIAIKDAAHFIGRDFNGFVVDEEMAQAVQVYIDAVRQAQRDAEPGVLWVFDLKFGRGVFVEVVGNPQLAYYALGAVRELPRHAGLYVEHKFSLQDLRADLGGTCDAVIHPGGHLHTVRVAICQPRCAGGTGGLVRAWQFPITDLIDWRQDLLDAAARTDDPDAPLVAGDHCKFCPAAGICPALEARQNELMMAEFKPIALASEFSPALLDKVAVGLDMADQLEARIEALRKLAYAAAEAGYEVPGWKLVDKRPTRRWTDEEAVKGALQELGDAIYTEPKLKSPAQIETLLRGKKRAAQLVGHLIESKSSGTVLARADDTRPEAGAARIEFKDITKEK